MRLTALVMAGGKATRMKNTCEKPLVKVHEKPMIEWVIRALRSSKSIGDVLVATSRFTPRTAELMRALSIKTVNTPGRSYCEDVRHAIKMCELFSPVLVISADLPLVTDKLIDEVVAYYKRCKKPALTVLVTPESYERLGLKYDQDLEVGGKRLVPVGINIVDGRRINDERMEEEVLILDGAEQAVNVNTVNDIRIAEELLARRMG
jgi:adenosylcobinamide-phosphate guanylyltransferase